MKNKVLYKIISGITIIAPLIVYLFLSATILNVNATHFIRKLDDVEVLVYELEDTLFLYNEDNAFEYRGLIKYLDEVGQYGLEVYENDIVKIDKKYFAISKVDDELKIVDINVWEISKRENTKLPIATLISAFAILIIVLIYAGKMDSLKDRKRLAVWLSLALGTAILYGINLIVSNMLNVFIVALVSWSIYCIEYLVQKGFINDKDAKELRDKANRI